MNDSDIRRGANRAAEPPAARVPAEVRGNGEMK